MCEFKIKKETIELDFQRDYRIGIVNIQMPYQLKNGSFYKIADKKRNINLLKNITDYVSKLKFSECFQPHFLLFPELSVSECAFKELVQSFKSTTIRNNTIAVLGLEQLTCGEFKALVNNSNSLFKEFNIGDNIREINTSAIITKDKNGIVKIFFQPKISRSKHESTNQYESKLVYNFHFGIYSSLILICSDFILQNHSKEILIDLLKSVDKEYSNPNNTKLNLLFNIQCNPKPINSFYEKSVNDLHYRNGFKIDTRSTIVCTVNAANEENLQSYRCSNVVLMDRGRTPSMMQDTNAENFFSWKSFKKEQGSDHYLNYVLWRLSGPGIVSFVLDTDERSYSTKTENFHNVYEPNILLIKGAEIRPFNEKPEVYEYKEILGSSFIDFLKATINTVFFEHSYNIYHSDFTLFLEKLFKNNSKDILGTLSSIRTNDVKHKILKCDFWEDNMDSISHFLLCLYLLYSVDKTVYLNEAFLTKKDILIAIVDCNKQDFVYLSEHKEKLPFGSNVIVLTDYTLTSDWNGSLEDYDVIFSDTSFTSAHKKKISPDFTKPRKPQLLSLNNIFNDIKKLHISEDYKNSIIQKINENFQFK